MQLNISTDYAIRMIVYMASNRRIISSKELSENVVIPRSFIYKIMRQLNKAGLVSIHSGTYGGYTLLKEPEEIRVYDIVATMEKTMQINRCLESDGDCSCFKPDDCAVHHYFVRLQEIINEDLQSTTIAMLAKN